MQMKMMARKLIANDQGGHLAAFQVTASQATAQQSMGALAVHVVATLISRSNLDPLCPMVTLLKAPGTLAVSLQFSVFVFRYPALLASSHLHPTI